jgi:uncharacterized membrane protein YphA (DoxX/SURF4 family)
MLQSFWLIDFLGIFLARALIAIGLFLEGIKFSKEASLTASQSMTENATPDVAVSYKYNKNLFNTRQRRKLKIQPFIYFISAFFTLIGLYSSFISIFWIFYLTLKIMAEWIGRKKPITDNLKHLYLLAFFVFLLFVGPGKLSLDRIFNIRYN